MFTLREHIGSPLSIFLWDPYCSSFCLFLTYSPTFSVSRDFTRSPVYHGIPVTHLFSLFLTCSPMLSVSLEITPVLSNKNSVVHVVLLLFLFTFLCPCCEDHCDISIHIYPQLSVRLLMSYV